MRHAWLFGLAAIFLGQYGPGVLSGQRGAKRFGDQGP